MKTRTAGLLCSLLAIACSPDLMDGNSAPENDRQGGADARRHPRERRDDHHPCGRHGRRTQSRGVRPLRLRRRHRRTPVARDVGRTGRSGARSRHPRLPHRRARAHARDGGPEGGIRSGQRIGQHRASRHRNLGRSDRRASRHANRRLPPERDADARRRCHAPHAARDGRAHLHRQRRGGHGPRMSGPHGGPGFRREHPSVEDPALGDRGFGRHGGVPALRRGAVGNHRYDRLRARDAAGHGPAGVRALPAPGGGLANPHPHQGSARQRRVHLRRTAERPTLRRLRIHALAARAGRQGRRRLHRQRQRGSDPTDRALGRMALGQGDRHAPPSPPSPTTDSPSATHSTSRVRPASNGRRSRGTTRRSSTAAPSASARCRRTPARNARPCSPSASRVRRCPWRSSSRVWPTSRR